MSTVTRVSNYRIHGKNNHYSVLRRIWVSRQKIPSWSNLDEIKEIYVSSSLISEKTGIKHVVDHVVPLRGKNVCGLHVIYNLEIIPKKINSIKSNKH